jgi:hypothetical protein
MLLFHSLNDSYNDGQPEKRQKRQLLVIMMEGWRNHFWQLQIQR